MLSEVSCFILYARIIPGKKNILLRDKEDLLLPFLIQQPRKHEKRLSNNADTPSHKATPARLQKRRAENPSLLSFPLLSSQKTCPRSTASARSSSLQPLGCSLLTPSGTEAEPRGLGYTLASLVPALFQQKHYLFQQIGSAARQHRCCDGTARGGCRTFQG